MKLIILLLTTAILQVSAGSFAQKITLSQKNASLEQVFKQISLQSGYDVLCDVDLLKGKKPVDINVKQLAVEDAMKLVLQGQGLTFNIKSKTIIITEASSSLLDKLALVIPSFEGSKPVKPTTNAGTDIQRNSIAQ